MAICLEPKHSDFRGYPWNKGEYSYTKSATFQRNNCPSGQTGSYVVYSKTYTSLVGPDDLNDKILADAANFNAEGQALANSTGTCSVTCTPKTANRIYGKRLVALSATQAYFNDPGRIDAGLYGPDGCFAIDRSLLTSGSGSFTSVNYIHNISTEASYPQGSNGAYRMVINSNNNFNLYYGSGSNKCVETIYESNMTSGGSKEVVVFDQKSVYLGIGHPLNGFYYLSYHDNIGGSNSPDYLRFYCKLDGGSFKHIGDLFAPSGGNRYGFGGTPSTYSSRTAAFIVPTFNGQIYVVAYTRRYREDMFVPDFNFDNNRTRTLIWRVNFDITGEPSSVTQLADMYSNQATRVDAATAFGPGGSNNWVAFARATRGSTTHYVIPAGIIPTPPLGPNEIVLSCIGDNTHIFLLAHSTDNGTERILYYTIATNSWSVGRTNL